MRTGVYFTIFAVVALISQGLWQSHWRIVSFNSPAFAQETPAEPENPAAGSEEKKDDSEPVKLPGPVPGISPETFRMIEMIEKKNRELKKKEEELRLKEQNLKTLEQKIRQDLKKINEAIARSEEQIGIQKNLIKERVAALVKAYSSMKPQEAAKLIEALNEDLAIQIVAGMKSKVAGKVLSKLDVKVAKRISEKIAGQKQEARTR